MARVEVTIPSMLATLVNGDRRFHVGGNDVGGVMRAVFDRHPELRVHLIDEAGELRQHVMLFHNDTAIRTLDGPVHDGDTVTVLQAVSGGAPASYLDQRITGGGSPGSDAIGEFPPRRAPHRGATATTRTRRSGRDRHR